MSRSLFDDWQRCIEIARDILNQSDGNWTHILRGEPVRYVTEKAVRGGVVIVFYRGQGYAATMPKFDWWRMARPIEGQLELPI